MTADGQRPTLRAAKACRHTDRRRTTPALPVAVSTRPVALGEATDEQPPSDDARPMTVASKEICFEYVHRKQADEKEAHRACGHVAIQNMRQ